MKNNQYDKIFEKKCDVCGKTLLASKTGNGECQYCGWYNNRLGEINENEVIFPNLISLNKAKILYQEGKPFRPDLNDFLDGLYFYSEMLFEYNSEVYEVFLKANKNSKSNDDCYIVFCSKNFQQEYTSRKEFENKANINGVLLKDMWDKIENPSFMYCD